MNPPPDPRDREAWRRWHAGYDAEYDRAARRGRRRRLAWTAGATLVLTAAVSYLLALATHWLSQ